MIYCLINPDSQSRRGLKVWKQIEKELKKEMLTYRPIITKSKEDIINAAKKLTRDGEERKVIIIGGDGTLNAFLNGIINTRGINIGYLPVGSGNDFARGMEITNNFREELDLILHNPKKRHMHYGIISYPSGRQQRFFVSAGMGYDAQTCYQVDQSRFKKILNTFGIGKLVYLVIGLKYLMKSIPFSGELTVDYELELEGDRFLFTSFHVLPYEGGGFKFCPDQRPEDNKLHICAVKGIPKWKMPLIIPQAFAGTHVYRRGVYQFRCDEAKFVTSSPQFVHTDGETDHKYDSIIVRISDDKISFLN